MTSLLGTALALARRGHGVLPLTWPLEVNSKRVCSCKKGSECPSAGKHPLGRLVPRGLLDATTDEATVRRWFADEPAINLGLATDLMIALDIDERNGGDESLHAIEQAHGPLPRSWRVISGGGGEHLLFACPAAVHVTSSQARDNPLLGPGVDVRAKHGYLVAAGSRHISGRRYEWDVDHHPADVPLAPAPPWLIARLARPAARNGHAPPPVPSDVWADLTAEVTEYADGAAARITGHLLRRGVDAGLVLGLMKAWNATCCKPPLALAELYRVVDRIAGKEAQRLEHANGG